jgi:molybdenum cofactor synthesis domain-containing protein
MAREVSGSKANSDGAGTAPRRALVVTVSDGVAAGVREDVSGRSLADRLSGLGFAVERRAVPDDRDAIESVVLRAVEAHQLVLLTGGTGLTPRDVTPQAVAGVIDYEIPGFGELVRLEGSKSTPFSYLSRSLAGVLRRSLVVAVPGSPRGALESLAALEPLLDHALETLAGPFDHERRGGAESL